MLPFSFNSGIEGAWVFNQISESGTEITKVLLIKDGYLTQTEYELNSKKFIKTYGGRVSISENKISFRVDFSSEGTPNFADTITYSFKVVDGKLQLNDDEKRWHRIDNAESEMAASWFITGRKRSGEMQTTTDGARRTLKLLTDTRFQWVAFNHDTGVFSGTGGGVFIAKNGNYIETIEFFSRDTSRVGAVLPFEFEIMNEQWHHRGRSSKGDPIYEIWSKWENIKD
jgi:hypothetical protein